MPSNVVVDLIANDKVTQAVNKAAAGLAHYASQAKTALAGVAGSFRGITAAIPGVNALAAALSAAGLAGALVKTTQLAKVQEDAERKLAAVLKATGGAAGLSADEIKKFAAARQELTNFGDEATIAVASVLATFKEIRGGAFKDALVAIQDVSTVMGQDMKAAAVQLGKALNDPIKGVSALAEAGVSFTAQQKAQIEAMQKAGNVLGAQKVILAELKSEFGGAAAAMADPVVQLKNAIGDMGEQIGSQLLPFVRILATDMKAAMGEAASGAQRATGDMGVLGAAVLSVADAVQQVAIGWKKVQLAIVEADRWLVSHSGGLLTGGKQNRDIQVEELDNTIKDLEAGIARLEKSSWSDNLRKRVAEVNEQMRKLREAAAGRAGPGAAASDASAEAVKSVAQQIDTLRKSLATPLENVQTKWRDVQKLWRSGKLDAETYRRAIESLRNEAAKATESRFGELLTQPLQAKLARQFADIERDFQQRFGRNLTPAQAAAERDARRKQAQEAVFGPKKSPAERSMDIQQEARTRSGAEGPFAHLLTNAERLRAEMKAIQESFQRGAFGAPGSPEAGEIARRSIAAALEQYGRKAPEIEKPRWEGLQDTWKRIQASAAGRGNSPEERAVRVAEANKAELVKVVGNTGEFVKWLQKLYEKKDDNRARAG